MPISEKVDRVFKKVCGATIAIAGEAAQSDLIFLGNCLGLTKEEMERDYPSLFESMPQEEILDHYPELEQTYEEQESENDE